MALDPLELIIIGVVAIVIFLWGPQKIPEIARAIGRARKEFEQASREISSTFSTESQPSMSGDQLLIETARKLGISTSGKTREQISEEIVKHSGR